MRVRKEIKEGDGESKEITKAEKEEVDVKIDELRRRRKRR